ncbi:hypothetical protein AVEN_37706-1 [Araneus ventricosus]|uniref:Uncharacterized protein n=1 Tax=Araneus ventricosus TaxID=182803 RepID=A0A4Y2BU34_ARAVE|nr:hypothetical protein AVEN_37706-1 [Araneus ventricosus]
MGRGEERSETCRSVWHRRLNIKDGQMWALVAFTARSPVFCEKEGVEVDIPWISSDPCISCKCQAVSIVNSH